MTVDDGSTPYLRLRVLAIVLGVAALLFVVRHCGR